MMSPEENYAVENGLNPNTSSNLCTNINSCILSELTPSSSHFKIQVILKGRNCSAFLAAMVDSGATALFISERFIIKN